MTRDETIKILAVLKAAYPNFYRDMRREEGESVVALWCDMFIDDEYPVVAEAVKTLIASDTSGYPPVIGVVKARVAERVRAARAALQAPREPERAQIMEPVSPERKAEFLAALRGVVDTMGTGTLADERKPWTEQDRRDKSIKDALWFNRDAIRRGWVALVCGEDMLLCPCDKRGEPVDERGRPLGFIDCTGETDYRPIAEAGAFDVVCELWREAPARPDRGAAPPSPPKQCVMDKAGGA